MSFDFLNGNNQYPPGMFNPNLQQYAGQNIQQPVPQQPQQMINPNMFDTPEITSGGKRFFSIIDEPNADKALIPVDTSVPDMEKGSSRRGRPKKETGSGIVRAEAKQQPLEGTVENTPTEYTYMETTGMLRETLSQIDSLNSELMQEFANVRHSRTMKNKYQTLIGLSENVGSLLNNKISAIREINSSISRANELDYKKEKDRRSAAANMDDDKYIADLYKSFIKNPMNLAPQPQMPSVDPAIFGSGVVRADLRSGNYNSNNPVDASYLNYVSNLTPEQNLMRYEGNNNIKQVVVYDNATGNRFFQMMDMSTGQVIPNVPVYDQMIMEDTQIDLATKIAKNININETFPVIVINEGVTSQY